MTLAADSNSCYARIAVMLEEFLADNSTQVALAFSIVQHLHAHILAQINALVY